MNIFGRKKDKLPLPLEAAVPETDNNHRHQYSIRAALAKAQLLFMLSFGAVNGFLSAYEIPYNRLFCAAVLLGLSLLMALLYEVENRHITNLAISLVFIVYAYLAGRGFRILNSGVYAVVNKMYETARGYLGVAGGNEYGLQIQNIYHAVTCIAVFMGAVGIILTAVRTRYKASFFGTFVLVFFLYPIPLYFDRTPDLLSIFLLLAGCSTLLIVQCSGRRKRISEQIRRALPIGTVLSAAVVLLAGIAFPQKQYRLRIPKNPYKQATEENAALFAQFGMLALFRGSAAGGVSGGMLSNSAAVMPRYKTDLLVRFTPYNMEPVYLRAFAGTDYTGDRWLDVRDVFAEDDLMLQSWSGRKEWFESDPGVQGRGKMEVVNVDANADFDYRPYYTDDGTAVLTGDTAVYLYYPALGGTEIRCEAPDERYLSVPRSCYQAVRRACEEAGLNGSTEEIAGQIVQYFHDNYVYTLRPGYYFGGWDYISYFLERNKKGYCSHFASAGTMLFRYMGIPARYVEGYAFSFADMALDGTLLEEKYEDYYSGYAPLGETAVVEVEVSDAQAHAWVEIYWEGRGWVVVDPTPAAREEEDVGSFWDNFGFGAGTEDAEEPGESGLSDYLGNVLEGRGGWLLAAVFGGAALFLGKKAVRRAGERKLPARERVRLEYCRLAEKIAGRNADFAALTTPAQELEWIRDAYGVSLPDGFTDRLYRAFYAPDDGEDCGELCRELIRLRRRKKANK